jgi:hypothetical protein
VKARHTKLVKTSLTGFVREEREVRCRRKDERAPVSHNDLNAIESNAVDGSSKNVKVGCGDEEN